MDADLLNIVIIVLALSALMGIMKVGAFLLGRREASEGTGGESLVTTKESKWTVTFGDCVDEGAMSQINPASGLPMIGSIDVFGNPYGWSDD